MIQCGRFVKRRRRWRRQTIGSSHPGLITPPPSPISNRVADDTLDC